MAVHEKSAHESKFDHEYLVKYKGLSYIHAQWLNATEIDAMNKKSKTCLFRYLNKLDKGEPVPEDGEIDPRFSFKKKEIIKFFSVYLAVSNSNKLFLLPFQLC